MSALDLDAIEARARAATPGPWSVHVDSQDPWDEWQLWQVERGCDGGLIEIGADAEHIAGMDPETTLALVARVRELESQVDRVRSLHPDMLGWCQECAHGSFPCRTMTALGGSDE